MSADFREMFGHPLARHVRVHGLVASVLDYVPRTQTPPHEDEVSCLTVTLRGAWRILAWPPAANIRASTIRRELLDHVIVLNEGHLRRRLRSYLRYYHGSRTHLALAKDAPESRAIEPPEHGPVAALPQVGGLHHRYVRRAA